MKLCVVTNYTNKGYLNEILIFNKLCSTLNITPLDIFSFHNLNSPYKINKEYTHALVLFDYKTTSIELYKQFLEEVKIPRIFVIDTIAHKHKDIHLSFTQNNSSLFTSLSLYYQTLLYDKFADGFVFYSNIDKKLFNQYYKLIKPKNSVIIPPSLGKKEDIKINLKNLSPNKLVGFNGVPSYSNNFLSLEYIFKSLPEYSLDVYGSHGREDIMDETLMNHLSSSTQNIKFKGKLNNYNNFYKLYHTYFNATIYDSFNYFTFLSLLNGVVPILSKNTGTSSYFGSYPFIAEDKPESVKYNIELINKTPKNYLEEILTLTFKNFKELNDETSKEKYYSFLNEF